MARVRGAGDATQLGVHIYTDYAGHQTGYQIIGQAHDLLQAAPPSMPIDGFFLQWIDYMGTVPMPDEIINGVKTKHVQARFSIVVTEGDA